MAQSTLEAETAQKLTDAAGVAEKVAKACGSATMPQPIDTFRETVRKDAALRAPAEEHLTSVLKSSGYSEQESQAALRDISKRASMGQPIFFMNERLDSEIKNNPTGAIAKAVDTVWGAHQLTERHSQIIDDYGRRGAQLLDVLGNSPERKAQLCASAANAAGVFSARMTQDDPASQAVSRQLQNLRANPGVVRPPLQREYVERLPINELASLMQDGRERQTGNRPIPQARNREANELVALTENIAPGKIADALLQTRPGAFRVADFLNALRQTDEGRFSQVVGAVETKNKARAEEFRGAASERPALQEVRPPVK